MDWDAYFIGMAVFVSLKSKDKSTQCGCVLIGDKSQIVSTGYNGIPRGLEDDKPARQARPEKYYWFEHAERNAIYNASLNGMCTKGTRAFITAPPCADCTRALIQSGIISINIPDYHNLKDKRGSKKWQEHLRVSERMLTEVSIPVHYIPYTKVTSTASNFLQAVSAFEPKFKSGDRVKATIQNAQVDGKPIVETTMTVMGMESPATGYGRPKSQTGHNCNSLYTGEPIYCVKDVSKHYDHYLPESKLTLVEEQPSDRSSQ